MRKRVRRKMGGNGNIVRIVSRREMAEEED
jgi:hypothetical protein